MKIGKNSVVTLKYRLTDAQGEFIEETEEPVEYLHGGYDGIFPRVEEELDGQEPGFKTTMQLEPQDAFGEYDADQSARRAARQVSRAARGRHALRRRPRGRRGGTGDPDDHRPHDRHRRPGLEPSAGRHRAPLLVRGARRPRGVPTRKSRTAMRTAPTGTTTTTITATRTTSTRPAGRSTCTDASRTDVLRTGGFRTGRPGARPWGSAGARIDGAYCASFEPGARQARGRRCNAS